MVHLGGRVGTLRSMNDDPVRPHFADIVGGAAHTDRGEAARREQELSHSQQQVRRTHEAVVALIGKIATELRQRNVPTDTGRFTPTGRGWRLPELDLWIAWDGAAYITHEVKAGMARQVRFDARKIPRNLFELPSWMPEGGGTRRRVILSGDRLIVSPGAGPFEAILRAAAEARAARA